MEDMEYAGFWIRVGASLIDAFLLLLIIMPPLLAIYGDAYYTSNAAVLGFWDFILNYVFPAVAPVLGLQIGNAGENGT